MAGSVKLLTSAGGGVILDTATTTATDVTVKVPVTGVNNGTLVCSDSSGNVGIGVTPSAWGSGKVLDIDTGGLGIQGATNYGVITLNAYNNAGWKYKSTSAYKSALYQLYDGTHSWFTAPSGTAGNAISFTQAMTLDASGNLLVACTTGPSSSVRGAQIGPNGPNGVQLVLSNTITSTFQGLVSFINGNGQVGRIDTSGTSTSYVTSSDYRLKENIQPMQNALDVVAQLNPVRYTWKSDGSDGQGFIAHELQAVVPDCVTGEKDAVDEEGKPVYQGIDTSFLVATLCKAIQEQQEQISILTTKVAALEVK